MRVAIAIIMFVTAVVLLIWKRPKPTYDLRVERTPEGETKMYIREKDGDEWVPMDAYIEGQNMGRK